MPDVIYNNASRDPLVGAVNYGADVFRAVLLTSGYTANKDTHTRRSDLSNEVVGTGYTAGGVVVAATVPAVDLVNDRAVIQFASAVWTASTITARAVAVYKSRGGAASSDELVAYWDFVTDQSTSNGTFTVNFGELRLNNPA